MNTSVTAGYDNYWEEESSSGSSSSESTSRSNRLYGTYDSTRAPNVSDLKPGQYPLETSLVPTWYDPAPPPPSVYELYNRYSYSTYKSRVALAIGIFGCVLGIGGLVAYCVVQTPVIRHHLGWIILSSPEKNRLYSYNNTLANLLSPDELLYGTEIVVTLVCTVLGLIVNALLIYGISTESKPFILPWLIYNVFFIASCFVMFAVVFALMAPYPTMAFGLIPLITGIVYAVFWVIILSLYRDWTRNQKEMKAALVAQSRETIRRGGY